jgi:hypothetical protein
MTVEVVFALAFFVIAALALGIEPFGLQLRSVDMFLIGLSLLAETTIFSRRIWEPAGATAD